MRRPGLGGRARLWALLLGVAVIGAACTVSQGTASVAKTTPGAGATTTLAGQAGAGLGPERVPIPNGLPLGPVKSSVYGTTIDGIRCETSEQVVYHIHAHLTVFVNGQPRQVPSGIGIAPPIHVTMTPNGGFVDSGSCFYWLHTHAADGVIHIESPTQQLYTLGQFFDMWGQPLAPGQVGPATGPLTVYVDGQRYGGNPRDIPLTARGQIQIDLGTPVAPQTLDWSQSAGL